MIIAIDGPAASGKSTTAKGVAQKLGFLFLDTGAMYRAVTLAVLRAGIDPMAEDAVEKLLRKTELSLLIEDAQTRILIGDEDVTEGIRGLEVTRNVSAVSALPVVRRKMVDLQRHIGGNNEAVVEGRDIGTVVFPDADFKFFLTADYSTRALRRQEDLAKLGIIRSVDEIVSDLKGRDRKDSTRSLSPLSRAEGALEIDTTTLTIDEQIDVIVTHVKQKLEERKHKGAK